MMLEDLKKSVSEMSTEELLNLLLEIRASRRTKRVEAATKKATKEDPMASALAKMNPEQMAMLAKMMGGVKNESH